MVAVNAYMYVILSRVVRIEKVGVPRGGAKNLSEYPGNSFYVDFLFNTHNSNSLTLTSLTTLTA